MTTAITGLRGTGTFGTDFRPTNYRELYTLLEPNGSAPLQALLAMAASESTDDPKYNHFRDELPDRYLRVAAGGVTSSNTTVAFKNNIQEGYFVKGMTIYNTRTGEVMLLGADADATNNTLGSVTRGVGNSGTGVAMLEDDALVAIGFADKENGTSPTAISWDATVHFNYTQIFKQSVGLSRTLKNTYLRTGSKEQEVLMKGLKLHMADMERAFWFGKRDILNGSTAEPTRFTGGIFSTVTGLTDAATGFSAANRITEKEFDRLLIEDIFAWGSKEKVAFCGPRVVSNFMQIAKNRWQPTQVDNAYGVKFTRYSTFAGDLLIYLHPMFRQVPDMSFTMAVLDMAQLKYRYLANSDTQLKREVQANDQDGSKHYYLAECGLDLLQDKPHRIIKNWQSVD